MMSVPVPDLLQMTHPGYRYVNRSHVLKEKDMPTFVDFCRRLIERFEHYGDLSITPPDFFKLFSTHFQMLFESDEPADFLHSRNMVIGFLEEFDLVVDNMQKAFSANPTICLFYRDVASTLRQTFEYHIMGDNE
jgi:hypothetical protein|tara:strand:+ start:8967 stop:9368 length:402 start_codon:yes stop_codon:yes gene_type:complete